jgi:hypothetical protein
MVAIFGSLSIGHSDACVAQSSDAAPQSGLLSDDVIDSVGDEVMNGNDFRSVRRRVLEQPQSVDSDIDKGFLWSAMGWMGDRIGDAFQAIGDFFSWLLSGLRSPAGGAAPASPPPATSTSSGDLDLSGFSKLMTGLAIGLIVAILVIIVAMVVKSVDAKRKRPGLSELSDMLVDVTVPPGERAVSTYESRAIQLAADGNVRAAIRELLLGSMSWIERAGLIRYRKGLTNRDYLRSLTRRPEKRDAYITTATCFEFLYFGRRVPTSEMFEQCLTCFRGAFREEESPTAAV